MTIKELYEYCTIRNIENYPIFINYETNEDEYFLSEFPRLYTGRCTAFFKITGKIPMFQNGG